jgi:hypothetical protein
LAERLKSLTTKVIWLKPLMDILLPNYALAGPLRGQSFCVKLKAYTKDWVAQWVHAELPR